MKAAAILNGSSEAFRVPRPLRANPAGHPAAAPRRLHPQAANPAVPAKVRPRPPAVRVAKAAVRLPLRVLTVVLRPKAVAIPRRLPQAVSPAVPATPRRPPALRQVLQAALPVLPVAQTRF